MIAILLFTHKNLDQTRRLINTLKHEEVDIYLHIDKKCSITEDFSDVCLLNRHDIRWGGNSQVKAMLDCLREIKMTEKKYEHYIFMSGQDYLISPISEIVKFLSDNKDKNFLEFHDVTDINIKNRYLEYHTGKRYLDALLRRVMPKRKLFNDIKVYFGSSWWFLTDEVIDYVISVYDSKYHGKLYMTSCIDEVLFQTILMNSKFKDFIVNDNKRYIDWSDHKKGLNEGNPNILKSQNFEEIIKSGKFIARKFDINVDNKILDMLDKYRGEL